MKPRTIAICFLYVATGFVFACHSADTPPGKNANQVDTASQKNNPTAVATAYKLDKDTGWGYKVFVNNKPYINQKHIPAIGGMRTFATQADAQKVGDWVAEQIRTGGNFGVSDSLMRALGVKY